MKLILNSCVDQMCSIQMQASHLDDLILKESNRGYFSAIREEEEDLAASDRFSKNSKEMVS